MCHRYIYFCDLICADFLFIFKRYKFHLGHTIFNPINRTYFNTIQE